MSLLTVGIMLLLLLAEGNLAEDEKKLTTKGVNKHEAQGKLTTKGGNKHEAHAKLTTKGENKQEAQEKLTTKSETIPEVPESNEDEPYSMIRKTYKKKKNLYDDVTGDAEDIIRFFKSHDEIRNDFRLFNDRGKQGETEKQNKKNG